MTNINGGVLDGVRRIGAAVRSLSVTGGTGGAPLGMRLMGATASGPPATGTWKAGDTVTDRLGNGWNCIAGGTPGTWRSIGLALLATTGTTGYTLVNGTGNVISWTAPNDGNLHRVQVFTSKHVSSTETGGEILMTFTDPAGTSGTYAIYNGGYATGAHVPNAYPQFLIEANTTVTISQASALSGGASVMYAEIWGS